MFNVTDEQYFYIIYAELQQRLSSECKITLVRETITSIIPRLEGICIYYKGIKVLLSYKKTMKDLKHKGKDIPFDDIITEVIRNIKEGIAEQFLKELE